MASQKIRPIRVVGNIAYVPLTKGHEAMIDAADVHLVAAWNWYAMVAPHTVYAVRNGPFGQKQRAIYMHRVILAPSDDLDADHIDRNGLNNVRGNLRSVTRSENLLNRRLRKPSASGLKGVAHNKATGSWRAQISVNGAQKYLGLFDSPQEAHAAYLSAAELLRGPAVGK